MSDARVKRTQAFFKKTYGQRISEDEAKQISRRITDYFRDLAKMREK